MKLAREFHLWDAAPSKEFGFSNDNFGFNRNKYCTDCQHCLATVNRRVQASSTWDPNIDHSLHGFN